MIIRSHQHYHWCEGPHGCSLTVCWDDGERQREMHLHGTNARAVHQRLLHAPDHEHSLLILNTAIDGDLK